MTHDGALKQDGSGTYEVKSDYLETISGVKGLAFGFKGAAFAEPSKEEPSGQAGIVLENDKLKFKSLTNVLTFSTETTLTYKCCKTNLFGFNIVIDPKTQKLTAYNFGAVWEPADKCMIGVKHESTKDVKELAYGKFLFMMYHAATDKHTFGSEFSYDYPTKAVTARLGVTTKLSDDCTGKLKVD